MSVLQRILRFLIYLILTGLLATPVIENDGYTYYAITRSLARDGDFLIFNDPVSHGKDKLREVEFPGLENPRPIFSGGFALAYAPFVKILPGITVFQVLMANLSDYRSESPRLDAFAILIATCCFSLAALVLAYMMLARRYSGQTAGWSVLAAFIGTPLLYYTFAAPSFSHALDAFALTAALCCLDSSRRSGSWNRLFFAGLLIAWSGTIRNINFIFIPVFLGAVIFRSRVMDEYPKSRILESLWMLAGMSLPAAFQLYYNMVQYGDMLRIGYQSSGVFEWNTHLIPMLFSPMRGLLVWTPLFGIGILGLLPMIFKDRWLALILLIISIVFLTSAQFFPLWWGGSSFGQRFATLLFLPVAAGTAELLSRKPVIGSIFIWPAALLATILALMFISIQHSQSGLQALRVMGSQFRAADIVRIFRSEMKVLNYSNPIRFISSRMSRGHVPALLPNLLWSRSQPSTVFITKLDGRYRPGNRRNIKGSLEIRSMALNPCIFAFAVWPFISADSPNEYPNRGKSRVFEVEMVVPEGHSTIGWTFDFDNVLIVDLPGKREPVTAPLQFTSNDDLHMMTDCHIEAGIFSGKTGRMLPLDIEGMI